MKALKFTILGMLSFASVCYAQIDTTKIENFLTPDRREFVHSLKVNLAQDDETTILRAHILKLVLCRVTSDAAKQFCKDLRESEDLKGQNVELLDFALSRKNLRLVLEALAAIYRGAQTYALNAEAKKQLIELGPIMAAAIAKVGDPIPDAAFALSEIHKRPEVAKAFGENVALRVYEPFLRDALYWLAGKEPDGRAEPWEVAGSTILSDEANWGCRIRKSGKFQCWHNEDRKRVEFPMETEEGYSLFITPNSNAQSMQVCSRGPENQLHCWAGTPTPDGGYDIEKCTGDASKPAPEGLLYNHLGQWYDGTILVLLQCEKSGERLLAYMRPEEIGKKARATNLASNATVEYFTRFNGTVTKSALFLNYACGILNGMVNCQTISKVPSRELNLYVLDAEGKPKDAGTHDIFRGFADYSWEAPGSVFAVRNGICATHKDGYRCRTFVFEGDKAIAMDFDSNPLYSVGSSFWNYAYRSPSNQINNLLNFETWGFEKKDDSYKLRFKVFAFTGELPSNQSIGLIDVFKDEKIVCFYSIHVNLLGKVDYDDPDWTSGASRRCKRLNEKYEVAGDLETALPLNQKPARPQKIGRALCLVGNQVVCDFPALAPRLFEHPVLSLDARSYFSDLVNGYICSAEPDSAVCYDLSEPGSFESLKKFRFSYKGISKEFMLSRDQRIQRFDPAEDPWMCTAYPYMVKFADQYVHTCESSGNNTRIIQIYEDYQSKPQDDDDYVPAMPVRTKKKKSRRRDTSLSDFYGRVPRASYVREQNIFSARYGRRSYYGR